MIIGFCVYRQLSCRREIIKDSLLISSFCKISYPHF